MKPGTRQPRAAARRRTRGAVLLEQLVLLALAVLGLIGFSRFGTELHEQLDQEAQHIRGRGTPGSDISLGALAGSYQPLPASGTRPAASGSTPLGAAAPGAPSSTPSSTPAASSAGSNGSASAAAAAPVRAGPGAASSAGTGASSRGSGRPGGSGASSGRSGSSNPGGASGGSSSTPPTDLLCGESGRYKFDLGAGSAAKKAPRVPAGSNLQRDHIPQSESLKIRAEQLLSAEIQERVLAEMSQRCRHLTPMEEASIVNAVLDEANAAIRSNLRDMVENQGFAVALPSPVHIHGLTYGNSTLAPLDAADLGAAAQRDMAHYLQILAAEVQAGNISAECADLVREVLTQRLHITTEQYEAELLKSVQRQLKSKSKILKAALEQRLEEEEKCR